MNSSIGLFRTLFDILFRFFFEIFYRMFKKLLRHYFENSLRNSFVFFFENFSVNFFGNSSIHSFPNVLSFYLTNTVALLNKSLEQIFKKKCHKNTSNCPISNSKGKFTSSNYMRNFQENYRTKYQSYS